MTVREYVERIVVNAISKSFPNLEFENDVFSNISVKKPTEKGRGDFFTNAAFVLCKILKQKPIEIAESISKFLLEEENINDVKVEGNGFLNIFLENKVWHNFLLEILKAGDKFGYQNIGKGEKVNVEYVSANPTGPLHIGHLRGAVIGDVIANSYKALGFDVAKEFYVNDAGSQIDSLAHSTYLRYRECNGYEIQDTDWEENYYRGTYIKDIAKKIFEERGNKFLAQDESDWLPIFKKTAVDEMMHNIKKDLSDMGVKHDVFVYESQFHASGAVEENIKNLQECDLVYTGVLPPPKGKQQDDWEEREQLLFRSTKFGDDVDRPLQKADGSWTYFAGDIAYQKNKINRGFKKLIWGLGADHIGYFKRMNAVIETTDRDVKLHAVFHDLVNLVDDGNQLKMSKRSGNFVTLRDMLDELGADILRVFMLSRSSDMQLDFDVKLAHEQSNDNPLFYIQYSYARAHSVLRNAEKVFPDITNNIIDCDLSLLQNPLEIDLIKCMSEWPDILRNATLNRAPHKIIFYLSDLSSAFNALYSNKEHDIKFIIKDDKSMTQARIALVESFSNTAREITRLLCIDICDTM